MSALPNQPLVGQPSNVWPAQVLDRALRAASPAKVIEAALETVGREQLALVSSFGTESAALLKVMADVDPAIPVIFLDTGWLFEETLAYRDTLIATLGLRDVRSIKPLEQTLTREDPDRELWFSDPDACCRIRKVEPLARALKPFSAWINGRKRFQGAREDKDILESTDPDALVDLRRRGGRRRWIRRAWRRTRRRRRRTPERGGATATTHVRSRPRTPTPRTARTPHPPPHP